MRMLLPAAAVAMLTGALTACGDPRAMQFSQSSAPVFPQPDAFARVVPVRPTLRPLPILAEPEQFLGTYPLHNGLLPNGLTPNPPTYG
jgi:hypothetical protein